MNSSVKKLTAIAALSALAYIVMLVGRIPITTVDFLHYDPKDVIVVVGGFIYGPIAALAISFVSSIFEMITVSGTGFIGLFMNVLSTSSFAMVAAFTYKKMKSISGAVIGLSIGVIAMTTCMILWNYFITPLYLGVPKEAVVSMLLPIFLPFNLIKGGFNAAVAVLIYKPAVIALRRAKLIPVSTQIGQSGKFNIWVIISSIAVIAALVICALFLSGVL